MQTLISCFLFTHLHMIRLRLGVDKINYASIIFEYNRILMLRIIGEFTQFLHQTQGYFSPEVSV